MGFFGGFFFFFKGKGEDMSGCNYTLVWACV